MAVALAATTQRARRAAAAPRTFAPARRGGAGRERLVGWRGDCARLLPRDGCSWRTPVGISGARAAASMVPPWSIGLTVPYAELHCLTNFTFLRGASHPHELVGQAVELGYEALAVTDECSVAGVVRAHVAAK